MAATSDLCRQCKPSYVRTPEHNLAMSRLLTGTSKPTMLDKKRPEVGLKIAEWWTPDRREARRQQALSRNPNARYHGLSATEAKSLVDRIGRCEQCHHDGSDSRLDVHHKNRDKRDQRLENLAILCHRCHMQEHAKAGETGFDSMWKKRRAGTGVSV